MDKYVSQWLERSNYDLETAKAMLDAGRYLYVAYMCQQAIEKLLKAIIAQHGKENLPIHNLNRLAELAELRRELAAEQVDLLAELTAYKVKYAVHDARTPEMLSFLHFLDNRRGQTKPWLAPGCWPQRFALPV